MGLNQTPVLNEKSVQIGSAAMFYTLDNFNTFTGLGAADTLVMTETITPLDGEPDNAAKPSRADGVAKQEIVVTGNLWENDPLKIAAIRGGIDVVASTSGSAVSGASQVIASGSWGYDIPFELLGQDADGTAQAITSVTGSVDGALTVRTDYVQSKNSNNKWGIAVTDSTTVTTEAQTITIVYDYTPASNVKVTTGGLTAAGRVGIRMINRTVDKADATVAVELSIAVGTPYYYVAQYDVFYCIVNAGEAITFKNKDDTSPTVTIPISLIGESDPDRAGGANLRETNYFNEVIPS
ncbi:MAG: hypothetical protein GY804_13915 [Alphaproteobacteria bacterium]|nr:hypothetical protein [Alphaproteobacteria bacterium]